jgi:hypothetical protein
LIFQVLTESKQKQQIINNTMPMKYQKEYFRVLKGLNPCNSSNIVFAISAGAAPDRVLNCMAKICYFKACRLRDLL